ncbi:23S rRNA pseudouridine(2605) synthase RluB [Aquisalimonas asiatica]|uniref:Pseudouridine synthase n=1 Tax=Aquisalimonas asiatica TaxID=406100 RepID=A0A1H8RUW0_9GAMM|nr:pseudouridine synthase [Aquisalimonas asiatica]SEO70087.1 ribosomal large subunit pseudouridine synthase B [Aquisalimonas asiatica]
MSDEKLQKVLARAGLGSRREVETWIQVGRVRVNGQVATLGDRVTGAEHITVDGRRVPAEKLTGLRRKVLMYHKPVGEVTSRHDTEGRPTVFQQLPRLGQGRWISIGRLDLNTLGLLLFTNDGELANRLMHPSWELEREYACRVFGEVDQAMLNRLTAGVVLDDGEARFDSIVPVGGEGGNTWYHVVVREGRQREVRRLWESQDVAVSRLIRVRYGPVSLPHDLPRGKYRFLEDDAIAALCRAVDLDPRQSISPDASGGGGRRKPAGSKGRKPRRR